MDIISLIKNENEITHQRWKKVMSEESFAMEDWRSQLSDMILDILATEEAKDKVVFNRLREQNKNSFELKEMETLASQLHGSLIKLHEIDRFDLRWDGWKATASNILRTKMAFETQLLEELEKTLDEKTKAQLTTTFERCRQEGPKIEHFQVPDSPVVKNKNFA